MDRWTAKYQIEQYVFPIREYLLSNNFDVYKKTFIIDFLTKIKIDETTANIVCDMVVDMLNHYAECEYRVIPIFNDNPYVRCRMMCSLIGLTFNRYSDVISNVTLFDDKLRLLNLTPEEVNTIKHGLKITSEGDETTTFGKVVSSEGSDTNFGVTEDAPIDSSDDITTPDSKFRTTISKELTTTNDGEDVKAVNKTDTHSGEDVETKIRPDTVKIFMDLVREFNVYECVDKVARSVIYEFNSAV